MTSRPKLSRSSRSLPKPKRRAGSNSESDCWVDQTNPNGGWCGAGPLILTGLVSGCVWSTGTWTISIIDNGIGFPTQFSVVRDPSNSPIAITSPPANTPVPYLVQLNTPNAQGTPDVATAPVQFSANTNQGTNSDVTWNLSVSYLAGYAPPYTQPTFGGPTPQATPTFALSERLFKWLYESWQVLSAARRLA